MNRAPDAAGARQGPNAGERTRLLASTLLAVALAAAAMTFAHAPEKKARPAARKPMKAVFIGSVPDGETRRGAPGEYAVWSPATIALPLRVFQRRIARGEISGEISPPVITPRQSAALLEQIHDKNPPGIPTPPPASRPDFRGMPGATVWSAPGAGSTRHEPRPGYNEQAVDLSGALRESNLDITPLLSEQWPATDLPLTLKAHVYFADDGQPDRIFLEQPSEDKSLNARFLRALRQCFAQNAPVEGSISFRLPHGAVIPR